MTKGDSNRRSSSSIEIASIWTLDLSFILKSGRCGFQPCSKPGRDDELLMTAQDVAVTYVDCRNINSAVFRYYSVVMTAELKYLFPSITSTKSSAVVFGSLMAISALLILYSLRIAFISSWSMFVSGTVFVIAIPPFSFLRTVTFGGFLLRRMPNPSSSVSMIFLSPSGLRTSRTMKMR